jgi:hypothetical protein
VSTVKNISAQNLVHRDGPEKNEPMKTALFFAAPAFFLQKGHIYIYITSQKEALYEIEDLGKKV